MAPSKQPPRSEHAYVVARAGFQSLSDANKAVRDLFAAHEALGEGTAGSAFVIPTSKLSRLFRDLADILDATYQHQYSGEQVRGSRGIDNWSIAIQAEKPRP